MLVFVDESGDAGFKFSKGSTPVFVVAMVIFQDSRDAAAVQARIVELARQWGIRPEFKFNKCRDEVRDAFFQSEAIGRFVVRAIVVHKDRVYAKALRDAKESFHRFFVRMMMQQGSKRLRKAKVVIDGSGDREFKREMSAHLRKSLGPDSIETIALRDSRRDPLLQLADMVAGAIARSYRTDRPTPDRWRNMLSNAGMIEDVWEFK